jgi:hypothetical protein
VRRDEQRRRRAHREKDIQVQVARGALMRALEEDDAPGDEHLLRAMIELARWRQTEATA